MNNATSSQASASEMARARGSNRLSTGRHDGRLRRSRRVSAAQVGATALFLVLGSVGSFLLGVEIAAGPGPAMVASDQHDTQALLQAYGSLGTADVLASAATNVTRRSTGVHVKVGNSSGKNGHGQNGSEPGTQGQPGIQNTSQSGGTGTSGSPATSGGGTGTSPTGASGDGAVPGSSDGSSTPTPGATPVDSGTVMPSSPGGNTPLPASPLMSPGSLLTTAMP